MAYQLWTSPITGYRRKGTRFSDVRSLFESGITTRAIFEPLKSCPVNEDVFPIEETMRMRDFDVLGVMDNKNGSVIGYVHRSDLTSGMIKDHVKNITPKILVADSAPISELFELFKVNTYFFVLNKTKIEGIVTQADLNKPPVRVYLFGLISLLEMHIGFWVRNHYKNDSWQNDISSERVQLAQNLYDLRKNVNLEIGLFECLQFCDKYTLLFKGKDLWERLSKESKTQGKKFFHHAESLRNNLAHSQQDISEGLGWETVFDTVSWIEKFLSISDQSIEQRASKASEKYNDLLL